MPQGVVRRDRSYLLADRHNLDNDLGWACDHDGNVPTGRRATAMTRKCRHRCWLAVCLGLVAILAVSDARTLQPSAVFAGVRVAGSVYGAYHVRMPASAISSRRHPVVITGVHSVRWVLRVCRVRPDQRLRLSIRGWVWTMATTFFYASRLYAHAVTQPVADDITPFVQVTCRGCRRPVPGSLRTVSSGASARPWMPPAGSAR
jgi:hypothetical protein